MQDHGMDRRSALKFVAGGAIGAGLSFGAGGASAQTKAELVKATDELITAAKKEGTLYIRHSAQNAVTDAIAAEFTKKYGVQVTTERRVSAEGTNTFLTEERAGRHIVDVHIQTDRPGMISLAEQGYYKPYVVENDADYDPSVKFRDFAYSVYFNTASAPCNTKTVSPEAAVSLFSGTWNGLLDPRFKGKRIGIISPYITIASSGWFWALSESPKYGGAFLQKVADMDPVIYSDQALGGEGLFAGEVDILLGLPLEECWRGLSEGATLAWGYPDLIPAIPSVFHFLSSNAPHPNAARLYLAWTLSREGQEAISVAGGRSPTTKLEVPMAPKMRETLTKNAWWKPMPASSRWSPTVERIISDEDGYRTKMSQMFKIPIRK